MQKISPLLVTCLMICGCGTFRSPSFSRSSKNSPSITQNYSNNYSYSATPSNFELIPPVKSARITQSFAPKHNPSHQGIDYSGHRNKKIFAAHDGVVVYVGRKFSGYGKMILIEYNHQWATLYAHLHSFNVREGDFVKKGEHIGGMGNTGRSTGTHLHFELIKNKQPVNPIKYFRRYRNIANKNR